VDIEGKFWVSIRDKRFSLSSREKVDGATPTGTNGPKKGIYSAANPNEKGELPETRESPGTKKKGRGRTSRCQKEPCARSSGGFLPRRKGEKKSERGLSCTLEVKDRLRLPREEKRDEVFAQTLFLPGREKRAREWKGAKREEHAFPCGVERGEPAFSITSRGGRGNPKVVENRTGYSCCSINLRKGDGLSPSSFEKRTIDRERKGILYNLPEERIKSCFLSRQEKLQVKVSRQTEMKLGASQEE